MHPDNVVAARAAWPVRYLAAALPVIIAGFMATGSASAGERDSVSCIGSRSGVACVRHWGVPGSFAQIIQMPRSRDEAEIAAAAERDRLWLDRCRPESRKDRYGVRRFTYAAAGCEFGRFED